MTNIEIIVNALLDNGVIEEEEEALELVENDELKDYKSFDQWKQLGFSIKKGEHRLASCLIWKPEETTDEDGKKASRFVKRWANIFSKEQVEKTADRKARRELEKANAQKTEKSKKAEEPKANSQKTKKAEPKAKKELATVKAEKPKAEPKKNSKKTATKTTKTAKAVSQYEKPKSKYPEKYLKIKESTAQRPFINLSNAELAEYIQENDAYCKWQKEKFPNSEENSFAESWNTKAKEELAIRTAKKEKKVVAKAKKNSQSTPKVAEVKAVKTEPKKNSKNAITKKTEVGKMSSRIEQGKEIIRIDLEKADGTNAWIEMTKDFYMNLKKTQKKQLEKMWGLA